MIFLRTMSAMVFLVPIIAFLLYVLTLTTTVAFNWDTVVILAGVLSFVLAWIDPHLGS
jgi:hypothetical protein